MKTETDSPAAPWPRLMPAGVPVDTVRIARILGGEKEYFELLIRRYNGALYRVGHSMAATTPRCRI